MGRNPGRGRDADQYVDGAHAAASGRVRMALDSTADVVLFDADVTVKPVSEVGEAAINSYVERSGWDPRTEVGDWAMLFCRPTRMQVWNSATEISGRTIMSDGIWRSDS